MSLKFFTAWKSRAPLSTLISCKVVEIIFGSGALSGKMLLARIVEINEIYAYFRPG